MFSRGIERDQWHKKVLVNRWCFLPETGDYCPLNQDLNTGLSVLPGKLGISVKCGIFGKSYEILGK